MIIYALVATLVFSLIANAFAVYLILKSKKEPVPTLEARDLIHDITKRGRAILEIRVIDPENLYIMNRGR